MEFYPLVALLAVLAVAFGSDDWTYYNGPVGDVAPADWPASLGDCDGTSQSPIDIDSDDAEYDSTLGAFTMTGGYMTAGSDPLEMSNTGHGLEFSAPDATTVTGGGLDGTMILAQFHMHWGSAAVNGSEHTMDGKHYAAEIHFVHYNGKYANLSDAVPHADGLAVLGVFVEESGSDNTVLAAAFSKLDDVKYADNVTMIDAFKLSDLFPSDTTSFYRYSGSLTTPGCNEVVTWTVFEETIKMSASQMAMLRTKMVSTDPTVPLIDNWRPVQAINGREVKVSYKEDDGDDASLAVSPVSGFFSLVVAIVCAIFVH